MEVAESSAVVVAERTKLTAIFALARPYQWLKNGLVLPALLFGQRLFDPHAVMLACVALAAFCAISSTGYVINDICDRETDRLHPEKCSRPLAAGELRVGEATRIAATLGIVGF